MSETDVSSQPADVVGRRSRLEWRLEDRSIPGPVFHAAGRATVDLHARKLDVGGSSNVLTSHVPARIVSQR